MRWRWSVAVLLVLAMVWALWFGYTMGTEWVQVNMG